MRLRRRLTVLIFFVCGIGWPALGQTLRNYTHEMPCADVPIAGFSFQECWQSDPYVIGGARYLGFLALYSDAQSKVAMVYMKARDFKGTFRPEHSDDILYNFRTSPALSTRLAGMTNVGEIKPYRADRYFSFDMAGQHCQAFNRFGEARADSFAGDLRQMGGYAYVSRGFFCRTSDTPVTAEEVRFLTDKMVFK